MSQHLPRYQVRVSRWRSRCTDIDSAVASTRSWVVFRLYKIQLRVKTTYLFIPMRLDDERPPTDFDSMLSPLLWFALIMVLIRQKLFFDWLEPVFFDIRTHNWQQIKCLIWELSFWRNTCGIKFRTLNRIRISSSSSCARRFFPALFQYKICNQRGQTCRLWSYPVP